MHKQLVPEDRVINSGVINSGTERGSTVPLLLVVVVAACWAAIGLAHVGGAALLRAQAQQAADAAALAGASATREDAIRLAHGNGASIEHYVESGDDLSGRDVEVVVRIGDVTAAAAARWDPPPTTEPPATEPPATEPPITEIPTTEPPISEVPTTGPRSAVSTVRTSSPPSAKPVPRPTVAPPVAPPGTSLPTRPRPQPTRRSR
jgi:hypothetical protein